MLVNVITRFPVPPLAVLAHVIVENPNEFGAHSITVLNGHLQPAIVEEDGSTTVVLCSNSAA